MKMVTGDEGSGKCGEKQVRSHKEEVKKETTFHIKARRFVVRRI